MPIEVRVARAVRLRADPRQPRRELGRRHPAARPRRRARRPGPDVRRPPRAARTPGGDRRGRPGAADPTTSSSRPARRRPCSSSNDAARPRRRARRRPAELRDEPRDAAGDRGGGPPPRPALRGRLGGRSRSGSRRCITPKTKLVVADDSAQPDRPGHVGGDGARGRPDRRGPSARLACSIDETYRDMTYGGPLPLAATLSERAIGVSSLSKADGLPGHPDRLAGHDATPTSQGRFLAAKEQILITNSVVDEAIAEVALLAGPSGCRGSGPASRRRSTWSGPGWPARTCSSGSSRAAGSSASRGSGPDVPVDVDAFYRILLERLRHGRRPRPLVRPAAPALPARLRLADRSSSSRAWPRSWRRRSGLERAAPRSDRRRGAAIGNALLEMDRQIFRDIPRVEEMVRTGSETVGLSGDGADRPAPGDRVGGGVRPGDERRRSDEPGTG